MASNEDNVLSMLSHLLGVFTGFLGPLVMFLVLREKRNDAYQNARHALNFQISLIIYYIISGILIFVIIGVFLIWALAIFQLVMGIIAAVKSYGGMVYRYPLEIEFLKK